MINLQQEFPLDPHVIYLNHAAVAPWPQRTVQAVSNFANENGKTGAQYYPKWLAVERQLKKQLAQLIHAPSDDDIALLKNTSEGLSLIAYGIAWQPGDEIIISDQEFPSNRIVWESLGSKFGVVLRQVSINGPDPESAIAQQITPRTRLLSISSVQYGSGFKMDLARLGALCHQHRVLFCIDAIQSLGCESFDAQAYQADFVVADGHKWMLGPEGTALFYARPQAREQLQLLQYGWHMVAEPGDYDQQAWEPHPGAQRFECGSPNMLGIHALQASTELILEIGVTTIQHELNLRIDYLSKELAKLTPNLSILTPPEPFRRAGILTFQINGLNHSQLHRQLMNKQVICAQRAGGIRFSPHFHTPYSALEQALAITKSLLVG